MEDKLKKDVNPNGFHYPDQYETMSVETALGYLDLGRDGHGAIFTPDNYDGFLSMLVLKCGVDIDYAFGETFKEDADEIKKHYSTSQLSPEELEEEIKNRIEKKNAIAAAQERYDELVSMKKILLTISRKKPSKVFFENKTATEINSLYTSKKR